MIQKIITSIHHDVSNPHRFDVISFAKFVRINVQWNYRTTKVTQLFLVRPYTRITLLGFTPNVMLTHVVATKKFFCDNNLSHKLFMLTKIFCWHIFFKIFSNNQKFLLCSFLFSPLFSLLEGNIKGNIEYFPQQNIFDYFVNISK